MNYSEFVEQRLAPNHRLLHIAIGLVGEWFEYCEAPNRWNALEELGDILFYLQAGCNHFNIQYDLTSAVNETPVTGFEVNRAFHDFLDMVKKKQIYGLDKPVLKHFEVALDKALSYISSQVNIESLIEDNVCKLSKRYATSFTPQEAEARKDK